MRMTKSLMCPKCGETFMENDMACPGCFRKLKKICEETIHQLEVVLGMDSQYSDKTREITRAQVIPVLDSLRDVLKEIK